MPHLLVMQLKFARCELLRGLEGLSDADAAVRFLPMNCIAWNVAHLANQEQRNWLTRMQGRTPWADLQSLYGYGALPSSPMLSEVLETWRQVTAECDRYLDLLDESGVQQPFLLDGKPSPSNIGTMLLRQVYHYWYHLGENMAIRQMLGHTRLAEYVGDLQGFAPYTPSDSSSLNCNSCSR
ncbi:MAG TPA: DinB family protein [Anaerolineaceae bacterium]